MNAKANINATRQSALRTGSKISTRAPVLVVENPPSSNVSGLPSQTNRPPHIPEVPPSKRKR